MNHPVIIPEKENLLYNVLMVDDRPENLITLEKIIEHEQRYIVIANSGNDALKIVLHQPIDLIMLDIQMPEMDGFETAGLLRMNPKTKHIPIIFVSAFASQENKPTEKFEPGTVDFLAKPLDINEARQKVNLYEKIHILGIQNKLLNEKLKMMSDEMQHFVYSVSHDIKAPIRAIENLAAWIEEELGQLSSPTLAENFALLKSRIQRAQNMLDGLTEFSRASLIYETEEPFSVGQLIHSTIKSLQVPDSFRVLVQENMPQLSTGKNKLTKIFSHLIGNAIKHHHSEQGTVEISCIELEDTIQFMITDDGPGIKPQYHETVFELFHTLQSRDKTESTGAGLAIARKIVNSAGGKIWMDAAVKEGTKIYFTWNKK